ncbi:ESPR-type extended signal peptide-containing protein [uncultured Dialister sp.]|uniref:ESPR-type extended signal peptide-containing protein n=1 Tax=uncultured Dialister sp. TaxID=278064 RepID=UPI0025F1EA6E|nr:ESPR-type extended signal peptide-containing protein [uncultured Dialister sp.]
MNRVYKVIYSKASQCAMVVSELAKSSRKGADHAGSPALARIVAAVLAAGVLTWGIAPGVSWAAADTTPGSGNGVAIGTGSNAPKAENVAIGKGATISYSNGASSATGDIVVGNGANINNYASQGGSIAIGKNAKVENMAGGGEASFAFGQTTFSGGWWSSSRIPADPSKVVGSIAIGDNTFARTGSTMIGSHNYKGELGDTTVDSASTRTDALNVYATTIGANSFSNGAFTTSTGAYNIISSDYNGGRLANPVRNMGATITGALNSIESIKNAGYYSGIANTINGIANRTSNSNGTLIYGAGNEVTNSITTLTSIPDDSGSSAKAFADTLRKTIKDEKGGGATLVIGGGNMADYTQKTQILGVNNAVTGTKDNISKFNMVNGYQNTVTGASHVKVLGQNVTINKGADSNTVIGDYRTVADNQTNNVIIGNADEKKPITTEKKETVILGYKSNATVDGGVAIGSGSLANIGAGVFGWDPKTKIASISDDKAWKSSWAAVSIGDSTHTRQITNLAAGFNDTDAVNVAQLKAAMENAAPKIDFVAGDGIQIEKDPTGTKYTIKANIIGGQTGTNTTTVKPKEEGSASGTGSSVTSGSGKALEITTETNPISFAADEGTAAKVKPSETLGILGDKTNIYTKVDGSNITVSLKKDISVDSVKAGNTTVNNEGVTIAGGPSMTVNGINAGGKKITNVADGTDASDAVNYGQLQNVENQVTSNTQNINYLNGRVGELGDRINKVGAGAAALAALHPLDYDPEDKWDFAAGVGNYRNATAAAVGLFYRPNERTMFNLGWTMGDNRNMVNGGFSLKFGKSNKYIKYSKAEMASVIDKQSREIAELKARDVQNAKDKDEMKADNAEMKAEIEALKKQVEALAAKK